MVATIRYNQDLVSCTPACSVITVAISGSGHGGRAVGAAEDGSGAPCGRLACGPAHGHATGQDHPLQQVSHQDHIRQAKPNQTKPPRAMLFAAFWIFHVTWHLLEV
jgi:hypothetical protein